MIVAFIGGHDTLALLVLGGGYCSFAAEEVVIFVDGGGLFAFTAKWQHTLSEIKPSLFSRRC